MVVAIIAIICTQCIWNIPLQFNPSSNNTPRHFAGPTLFNLLFIHWHFHLRQILLPLPSKQVLEFCCWQFPDKSTTDKVVSTIEQVKTISKQYRKHRRMNLCVACAVLLLWRARMTLSSVRATGSCGFITTVLAYCRAISNSCTPIVHVPALHGNSISMSTLKNRLLQVKACEVWILPQTTVHQSKGVLENSQSASS